MTVLSTVSNPAAPLSGAPPVARPGLLSRISLDYRQRVSMLREWARHDAATYRLFTATLRSVGVTLEGRRVLDVGCGANAPMTLILHSSGVKVTGVDGYLGYRWGLGIRPGRYARYLREAGLAKTMRKAIGEVVYDHHYYRTLQRDLGFRLTERGLDLRAMAVESLDLPDGSADVVHSNATWEHLADVDAANRELARVLAPGGVAYVEIHLFPSLSGGHDLPWIVPGHTEMGGIEPWGHLRDPRWTPPVFLNRLRESDYRTSFESTPGLAILDWKVEFTEGDQLVTPEILAEVPHYTAEDLTRRSIIVVVRRN